MNSRNRSLLISSAVVGLVCGVALTQQQVKAATEDPAASSEKVVEVQASGSKTEADTSVNDSNGVTNVDAINSNSNSGNEENSSTNESTEVDKNGANTKSTEGKHQVSTKASQSGELIDQGTWGTSKWEYAKEGDDYVLHVHEGTLGKNFYDPSNYTITGFVNLNSNFRTQLTKIKFDSGVIANQYSQGLFCGLTNLTSIEGMTNLNTSSVTTMSSMFRDCSSLTDLDLSSFDTSAVIDMSYMFSDCTNLQKLDLSHLNTSKLIKMNSMFSNCNGLVDINFNNIDTSNVTDMNYMFSRCTSIPKLDLGSFNTSNVTDMNSMFNGCINLTKLNLDSFNTSNVENMSYMFYQCQSLSEVILKSFDTSQVTDMSSMFADCSSLQSLDIDNFNTKNVTDMSWMFSRCKELTNIDVSHFNTSNVENMSSMFSYCNVLTSIKLNNFDTSQVTIMDYMFKGCSSLTGLDLGNFNTTNVKQMDSMFDGCKNLSDINLSSFNTENVNRMNCMFNGCESLSNLDLSNFNTSKVASMYNMFAGCKNLIDLNIRTFDTSKVQYMQYMFSNCESISNLNLSSFNTVNASAMFDMFSGCKNLRNLDLSNFNISDSTSIFEMFSGCDNLNHLVLGENVVLVNSNSFMGVKLPKIDPKTGKKIMWKATEGYQKGRQYTSDDLVALLGRDQVTTYDWSNEKNIIKTTTESKTVTRLINIHQPVGGVKSVEQTAVISREVNTYDDGTTDYGEWSKSQWNACEIPTFAGYEANIKEIPAQVITDQTTNQTIDVTYGPAKQIVTIQYIDKGNVIGTQQIRGEIGEKIKPNYEVPAGYILVCPPTIITVDKSGNQVVKINVKHEIVKGTESRTVTRTINVHQPDGSVTTTKQVVTLSRSYTEDKATGQKTYASWRTGNWTRVTVPKLKGYTASSAFVPAEKVTSDSQDQQVDIYYTADK